MICPFRLLERRRIFLDVLHLLTAHEPGNELHIVPELSVPGGSVDYVVTSVRRGSPVDFVGVELQTLDTTGTVWPARERLLRAYRIEHDGKAAGSDKRYGMNWKMTAKTVLMQLHHKLGTFEHVNRKLVVVMQDVLLSYMKEQFSFAHVSDPASQGEPMHFHSYSLVLEDADYRLELDDRVSTDSAGMAQALGLHAEANVELVEILDGLAGRIGDQTRFEAV